MTGAVSKPVDRVETPFLYVDGFPESFYAFDKKKKASKKF